MLLNIPIWVMEVYLPTNRHRKNRIRFVKQDVNVQIMEPLKAEFPVAFVVKTMERIFKNATSYYDFNFDKENEESEYKMHDEEIRTYKGQLYKAVRVTHGAAISTCYEPLSYIEKNLKRFKPYDLGGEEFRDDSIILNDDREKKEAELLEDAKKYIVFDGKVWERCGEPRYCIQTFGLGNNHGGTGFFISYHYNSNISNKNYFNALEREKAIEYGKEVAKRRGDTDSIENMGMYEMIDVHIPSLVKCYPEKDHIRENPFLDDVEKIICSSDSTTEAAFLLVTKTLQELAYK